MTYDPRDYAETPSELARDVLDDMEYREWRQEQGDRLRLRRMARENRNKRMRAVDPWADDYRGPA